MQSSGRPITFVVIDNNVRTEALMGSVMEYARLAKEAKLEDVYLVIPPLLHAELCCRSLFPAFIAEDRRDFNMTARFASDPRYEDLVLMPHIFDHSPDDKFTSNLRVLLGRNWQDVVEGGTEGDAKEQELKERIRVAVERGEIPNEFQNRVPDLNRPLKGQMSELVVAVCYADREVRQRLREHLEDKYYFNLADHSINHFAQIMADAHADFPDVDMTLRVVSHDNLVRTGVARAARNHEHIEIMNATDIVKWVASRVDALRDHLDDNIPAGTDRGDLLRAELGNLEEYMNTKLGKQLGLPDEGGEGKGGGSGRGGGGGRGGRR